RLGASPPGAVVVSSADHEASDGSEPLGTEESREALADGMTRSWRALEEAGSEVLAIVDTPWLGIDAPECVAEHLDDLRACAVPREEAVERSGAEVLAAAAERVPEVDVVDLDRKSTRLNSSHVKISYAVFCLKKKKQRT